MTLCAQIGRRIRTGGRHRRSATKPVHHSIGIAVNSTRSSLDLEIHRRCFAAVLFDLILDVLPFIGVLSPARSTAETWTNTSLPPSAYAVFVASSIGSMIEASSFSGLLTRQASARRAANQGFSAVAASLIVALFALRCGRLV